MKSQSSANQRSLKSLTTSPKKLLAPANMFSKNKTATNSRSGEMFEQPAAADILRSEERGDFHEEELSTG